MTFSKFKRIAPMLKIGFFSNVKLHVRSKIRMSGLPNKSKSGYFKISNKFPTTIEAIKRF
jgi:hypothetical protein